MNERAFAKINLCLDITGKRTDGYHYVDMVMQSVELCDELCIEKNSGNGIELTVLSGNRAVADVSLSGKNNLAYRAAAVLKEKYKICEGIRIVLEKKIPVAAGLAGGSSDAAAVLRGINRLFELKLSSGELKTVGAALGADIPFCIEGGCVRAKGIGDRFTGIVNPIKYHVLLAKPKMQVSTPEAYAKYDTVSGEVKHPDVGAFINALENADKAGMRKNSGNVLEYCVSREIEEISVYEKIMKSSGAVMSIMSGSGPTVFGVFEKESDAGIAKDRIRSDTNNEFSDLILTKFL